MQTFTGDFLLWRGPSPSQPFHGQLANFKPRCGGAATGGRIGGFAVYPFVKASGALGSRFSRSDKRTPHFAAGFEEGRGRMWRHMPSIGRRPTSKLLKPHISLNCGYLWRCRAGRFFPQHASGVTGASQFCGGKERGAWA
jgi:hypothetical protein